MEITWDFICVYSEHCDWQMTFTKQVLLFYYHFYFYCYYKLLHLLLYLQFQINAQIIELKISQYDYEECVFQRMLTIFLFIKANIFLTWFSKTIHFTTYALTPLLTMLFLCVFVLNFFFFNPGSSIPEQSPEKSFALNFLIFWVWDQQAVEGKERESESVNFPAV